MVEIVIFTGLRYLVVEGSGHGKPQSWTARLWLLELDNHPHRYSLLRYIRWPQPLSFLMWQKPSPNLSVRAALDPKKDAKLHNKLIDIQYIFTLLKRKIPNFHVSLEGNILLILLAHVKKRRIDRQKE